MEEPNWESITESITDSRFVGHAKIPQSETSAVRAGARIMYDALYFKLSEQTKTIEKLRSLLRMQETEPPFDYMDDMTTEFAVQIAEQTVLNMALKERVERLGSMGNDLGCMILENESLKAEIERLKGEIEKLNSVDYCTCGNKSNCFLDLPFADANWCSDCGKPLQDKESE